MKVMGDFISKADELQSLRLRDREPGMIVPQRGLSGLYLKDGVIFYNDFHDQGKGNDEEVFIYDLDDDERVEYNSLRAEHKHDQTASLKVVTSTDSAVSSRPEKKANTGANMMLGVAGALGVLFYLRQE